MYDSNTSASYLLCRLQYHIQKSEKITAAELTTHHISNTLKAGTKYNNFEHSGHMESIWPFQLQTNM